MAMADGEMSDRLADELAAITGADRLEDLITETLGLLDDSAEEMVLSGPYNVFCNKCRQHHPEAWTCAFWVQLNRIDEERRN